MSPWLRKLALTAHVAFSVSWIGAVAGFLALAVAGLTSTSEQLVRSAYMAMDLTGWLVIVPLCFASLLTGLVQGLGTPWGLFRHYWILLKLGMTVALTILLLVHMQPTRHLAAVAAETAVAGPELHQLQVQLAVDAAAALLALIVVVTLAVYKPRGMTRYGARKLREIGPDSPDLSHRRPTWVTVFVVVAIVSLLAVRTFSGAGAHHGPARHVGEMQRRADAGSPVVALVKRDVVGAAQVRDFLPLLGSRGRRCENGESERGGECPEDVRVWHSQRVCYVASRGRAPPVREPA